MNATPEQPESRKNRKLFYIIIIIVLLVINGLLFYNNLQTRTERDDLVEETETLEEEKIELNQKNETLLADIKQLEKEIAEERGINAEMDARLDSMQTVLTNLRSSYQKRINDRDFQISQLRKELSNTRSEFEKIKDAYLAEIEVLRTEKQELTDTLASRETNIEDLEAKIKKGEVLSTSKVAAYGVRFKSSNKEVKTETAKRVEKLMICFTIAENRLAEPGYKPLLIKVVSPEGSTLAVESLGSGTFTLANGESSLYTKKVNINYDPSNPGKEYCTDWTQPNEYMTGVYNVEVYHEGVLIGKSSFELEKGGLF